MTQTLPPRRDEYAGQFRYPPPRRAAPYNPRQGVPIPPPLPPAPRRSQTPIMWSVAGAVVAVAAVIITVALATTGADSDSSGGPATQLVPAGGFSTPSAEPSPREDRPTEGGSRDEVALHRLVEDFADAANRGPTSNWMDYYCAADQAVITRNGDGDVIIPTKGFTARTRLSGIEVTGKQASGYLDLEPAQFRKEAGQWKFCMTD